jgi:predicted nucleic acid-binding protein
MNRFLLDSDIIIWHLRGWDKITEMLRDLHRFGLPCCSAISVLEIQVGVKRDEEERTDQFFRALKIIDVSGEIAGRAAQLIRRYKTKGLTIDIPDAIVAGTCILHDLTLVTCNKRHYPFEGLKFHPTPNL